MFVQISKCENLHGSRDLITNYRKFFFSKISVSHLGSRQKCCPRKEWSTRNGWKGWRRRKRRRRNWRLARKRPPSLRQKRHALRLLPPSSASQRTENRRRKNASLDALLWVLHLGQVRSLTTFLHWFIGWLIDWLADCLNALIDWLIDFWLTWLLGCYLFFVISFIQDPTRNTRRKNFTK